MPWPPCVELAVGAGDWHWSPWLPVLLLYVAVGPSLVAYRCWGLGVATVGPSVAAFFGNLTPVFAAVMSAAMPSTAIGATPDVLDRPAF